MIALKRKRSISWIRIVLGFLLIILDPTLFGGPFLLIGVALLIAGLIGEDRTRDCKKKTKKKKVSKNS